jgi:hypothetical protein
MVQTDMVGNVTIGTLNANTGRVPIARGRNYIAMVDGTDGYTYDGTTFAQIADPDFPGVSGAGAPTHIVYIDGFFVVNDALTDNFFISAVEDPTSWNALDFEAAAVAPDNALAIASTNSMLWIIGDETAQAYYNSGNPDFPYDIILNATKEVGILAPDSLAESDDGMFYLATTPEGGRFVYRITGQSGATVSMDEQEDFLATVTDPTDAYGFIYKQAGKSFYALQLSANTGDDPRTSTCLVYNIKANTWENREISDGTAWRAGGHGLLNNRNIVGSRLQAQNLELDLAVYEDAGNPMIRNRRTQVYHSNNYLMDFWELVVDLQGGVGLPDGSGQGEFPILKMRYSDDAGQTWSSWLEGSIGSIGETMQRVVFRNLGQGRNRVFEVETSDPVPVTINNAYAVVEVLGD